MVKPRRNENYMTRTQGEFRKAKIEKNNVAGEREMVEDAVSKKEIERIRRKEKKK